MKFNCSVRPTDHVEVTPDVDGDIIIEVSADFMASVTLKPETALEMAALLVKLANEKPAPTPARVPERGTPNGHDTSGAGRVIEVPVL